MENLSILFAIDAEEMFNNGDFSSVIDLCMRGKEQYPDYPLGYIILSKAYNEIYDYENAQLIIAEAKAKFPINRLINSLSETFNNQTEVDNGSLLDVFDTAVVPESFISDEPIAVEEILNDSEIGLEPDNEADSDVDDISDISIESEAINEEDPIELEETISYSEIGLEPDIEADSDVDDISDISIESEAIDEEYPIELKETSSYSEIGLEPDNEADSDVIDVIIESDEMIDEDPIEFEETAEHGINENDSRADQENFLRLVVSYDAGDVNINSLKSSNPALIPGLNYTPLRARSRRSKERSDKHIPIFPDFSIHFGDDLIQHRNYDINSNDMEYDESDESVDNSPMIVSDTYASILVAQGAYSEALGTYKELCLRNPEKADFYNQKIEELQLMI